MSPIPKATIMYVVELRCADAVQWQGFIMDVWIIDGILLDHQRTEHRKALRDSKPQIPQSSCLCP